MITKFLKGIKTTGNDLNPVYVSDISNESSTVCSTVFEITLQVAQATAATDRSILEFDKGVTPIRVISALFEDKDGKQKTLVAASFNFLNNQLVFTGVANAANDKLIVTVLTEG